MQSRRDWLIHKMSRLLRRVGVRLTPFFVVHEGADDVPAIPVPDGFAVVALGAGDLDALRALRPAVGRQAFADRFAAGKRCIGMKRGDAVCAYMWIDCEEITSPAISRALAPDEAYLFDAYSDPTLRGLSLAPCLRQHCYAMARDLGRSRIYSISELRNAAARRFKAKLGAREIALLTYVEGLGLKPRTWVLQRPATAEPEWMGRL